MVSALDYFRAIQLGKELVDDSLSVPNNRDFSWLLRFFLFYSCISNSIKMMETITTVFRFVFLFFISSFYCVLCDVCKKRKATNRKKISWVNIDIWFDISQYVLYFLFIVLSDLFIFRYIFIIIMYIIYFFNLLFLLHHFCYFFIFWLLCNWVIECVL